MDDARLERRVAGVRHDPQIRLRERAMQVPRADHRADDVIPSLDDHGGDMLDAVDVGEELPVALAEAVRIVVIQSASPLAGRSLPVPARSAHRIRAEGVLAGEHECRATGQPDSVTRQAQDVGRPAYFEIWTNRSAPSGGRR